MHCLWFFKELAKRCPLAVWYASVWHADSCLVKTGFSLEVVRYCDDIVESRDIDNLERGHWWLLLN